MEIELKTKLSLIGAVSCWGAQDMRCGLGPQVIKSSALLSTLKSMGYHVNWRDCLAPSQQPSEQTDFYDVISRFCQNLSELSCDAVRNNQFFTVYGGDHSCAIGTWSGVYRSLGGAPFGLIWIDAHLDSHTPKTSHSGAIHGMPLAVLLGQGDKRLTTIAGQEAKLKPEHVCIVGARSYEYEEQAFLASLGVRVFYDEEVRERGLEAVLVDAKRIVSRAEAGYGVSIDLDSIDPADAPGVGSPEPGGLSGLSLCHVLRHHFNGDEALLGMEIAELNPVLDQSNRTSDLANQLLLSVM